LDLLITTDHRQMTIFDAQLGGSKDPTGWLKPQTLWISSGARTSGCQSTERALVPRPNGPLI